MIGELISKNEGKSLEFKEGTQSLPGIVKAVIAFANTAGGTLVIGVQDQTKKVVGVKDALKQEERLASVLSDSIVPMLVPTIEIKTYRKKELILIHVPYIPGPHYLKSVGPERGTFVRVGSTNRVADGEVRHALKLAFKRVQFDEMPDLTAKKDALDWTALAAAFKKVGKTVDEKNAENLGLLVDHQGRPCPSNGGIILFGHNRLASYPNALIRCVSFMGETKAQVLDHVDIDAYPVDAIDAIMHFVKKNTRMAADFSEVRRLDVPQFPPLAIREAVTNALLHADYSVRASNIMVAIFNDRIEISNPGGILLGMTLEQALAGSSRLRNRVLARVFKELKLVEQWGSGIQRIIEVCAKRGLKPPLFEDFNTEFRVTLYSVEVREAKLDKAQEAFVEHIKRKKRKVSTQEAAAFWDITPRNARVRLKSLTNLGVIRHVGTSAKDPKGGYKYVQP